MGRMRPDWVLEQGRFVGTYSPEEEVLLELTVPLAHNSDVFRIGWSLKGLRHSGWIAISTGECIWSRRELGEAADHMLNLLTMCHDVVKGGVPEDRR